jgi:hypothetical protein
MVQESYYWGFERSEPFAELINICRPGPDQMFRRTGPNVNAALVDEVEKFLVRSNARLWNHGSEETFVGKAKLGLKNLVTYKRT